MPFVNRWRIEGTLTTDAPLHTGSGETTTRETIHEKWDPDRLAEIAAVAVDHEGRAYLPGAALKGCLRSWLRVHIAGAAGPGGAAHKVVEQLLGSEDTRQQGFVGGKAEFGDAFALEALADAETRFKETVPYWKAARLTGVKASVAIDRRRKTAMDKKLFYHEFVPKGVAFKAAVTGQDLDDGEVSLLLAAMEGFNGPDDRACVGAETGDGYGRLTWKLDNILRLETGAAVVAWTRGPTGAGYAAGLRPLPDTDRDALKSRALQRYRAAPEPKLTVNLRITFPGQFLVNDPEQCKTDKERDRDSPKPDHAFLKDEKGLAFLPGPSLRGALRSQAERILRTLTSGDLRAACASTDSGHCCRAISSAEETGRLCLACRLFGAPGWGAPVEIGDFRGTAQGEVKQELVAIDRFTGGVSGSAKFDALTAYQPVLDGTIAVDLFRTQPWGLGLLALTLRDLMEGDIVLGFGGNKGYGACRASITGLSLVGGERVSKELQQFFRDKAFNPDDINRIDVNIIPEQNVREALKGVIEAFQREVATVRV